MPQPPDCNTPGWPAGYTYDPSSGEPWHLLRLQLGDVDPFWPLLSDAELKALLKLSGEDPDTAILKGLVAIIARLGAYTDESVGSVNLSLAQRLANYQELYKLYLSRQGIDFAQGLPYAGGISVTDNRTLDADTDRAPLYFGKQQLGPLPRNARLVLGARTYGAGSGYGPDPIPCDPDED